MSADKAPDKFTRTWENVSAYCMRLNVSGGWLIKVWNEGAAPAVCFMPDKDHLWLLEP